MNTQSSEGVNIYEQRNCLNQLDEEIERTIRELNSLNSQTMHQARQIQKKIVNPKLVSPNQSFSLNAKASPNTSFTDSLDYRDVRNNPKNTKSGHLQLSPGDLIPRDDPLKELGYASPDHQLMTDPKEYPFQQEEDFNQRIVLAQPFNFGSQNNDPKKLPKNGGFVQKGSPPRRQLCASTQNTRESTYNSQAPLRDTSNLNTSQSRKSLQNLMEYHKLSNLDIPKEKIHGHSRPDQYFGYQNNLRRKSGNQLERSPSASSVPSNSVVERLMQFGRQKEERLRMMRDGEVQKRVPYHNKNSRAKVSKSFMMGEDSSTEHRSVTLSGSNQMLDEQAQSVTIKRNSVGSAEMIKQQIDQAGGSQSELKPPKSIQQLDKEDIFYELYKEGYGAIPEASEIAENATTKGELQNMINNMKGRIQRDQSPSNVSSRGLTKSKSQTKVTYDTKVSYGTLTKYKHVEPRYLNPARDTSKSPAGHQEPEEKPKPLFRPQLSKKSLEIASRLVRNN